MEINYKISLLFLVLICAGGAGASCSTIKIGILLLVTKLDGNQLIRNEGQVRSILEIILLAPERYRITGYTRRVFSPEIVRTRSRYHSYYVITSDELIFFTLSFSGTRKTMRSQGAWAINTESDISSYLSYISGVNEWEVREIPIIKGIDTERTIRNIIHRIDNNKITYYYNDHNNNRIGMENCNTALVNTLVESP